MNALTEALSHMSRMPRWLLWSLAPMAAAALMSLFIDALQDNMRRGDEMRQTQRLASTSAKPTAGAPVGETATLR